MAGRRAGTFPLGMTQRLGVAAALLGDPAVQLLDEPVNGLDPDGVAWIRTLLRCLAAEGRTVFVASHLMSEMALTADHLIVIGRGRLLADTSVAAFVAATSTGQVRVRSPQPDRPAALLRGHGATVEAAGDSALAVTGFDAATVGELAASPLIVLHELLTRQPSLEEAFMAMTRDAVDYQPQPTSPPTCQPPSWPTFSDSTRAPPSSGAQSRNVTGPATSPAATRSSDPTSAFERRSMITDHSAGTLTMQRG